MFTDFWKIDLGTTLSILVPTILGAGGMVYRLCTRIRGVENTVSGLVKQLADRATLQDTRHLENKESIAAIQRILMGDRRPGR